MYNDPSDENPNQKPVVPIRIEANTPVFEFEALSSGDNLIYIELCGVQYELRRTKNRKLILNR